jgi:hypothetical protein
MVGETEGRRKRLWKLTTAWYTYDARSPTFREYSDKLTKKFTSVLHHTCNIHKWEDTIKYQKCYHNNIREDTGYMFPLNTITNDSISGLLGHISIISLYCNASRIITWWQDCIKRCNSHIMTCWQDCNHKRLHFLYHDTVTRSYP